MHTFLYYEFYIDQFFGEQFVMGCFLLAAAGGLIGIWPSWRLALGSLLNAVNMTVCILLGCPWLYPLGFFGAAVAAFWQKAAPGGWGYMRSCFLSLLTVTICFGGALEALLQLVSLPLMTAALCAFLIIYGLLRGSNHISQKHEKMAIVTISQDGAQIELVGLWDTGNQLREPLTGRPVSIADREALLPLLREDWEEKRGVCLIPYHSLGTTDGWMCAVTFDEMRVTLGQTGNKTPPASSYETRLPAGRFAAAYSPGKGRPCCKVQSKPLIALYDGNVSARKEYQMILHPEHAP